jgi:hypothetical protein
VDLIPRKEGSMKKLGIFVGLTFLLCCFDVNAQETMKFDNEGKKLQFIREMLLKEKQLKLREPCPANCAQMMKDLLEDKNFKAIEPDVRADSEDDPRLEKWNQCSGKDYHDFPDVDVKRFFMDLTLLGDPPYRYYRIELDGNKENGPEDMIYAEYSRKFNTVTGYTWVNLDKCEIMRQYPTTGSSIASRKPNPIILNLLVYYQQELWIIQFVEGYSFEFMLIDRRPGLKTCAWGLSERK